MWKVDVRPGLTEQFERLYGADGDWTKLSRRSRSFLGSSFLRDLAADHRYLLIEYWSEMLVYEKHVATRAQQAKTLEQQRDRLVERMEPLGVFTALDVPDRVGSTWSRRGGR